MFDMLWVFFEICIACFEVFIMKMMAEGFLKQKRNISKKTGFLVCALAVLISAIVSIYMNGILIMIVAKTIFISVLISFSFCKAKLYWYGIIGLLKILFSVVFESLGAFVIVLFQGIEINDTLGVNSFRYQVNVVANLLLFLFINILIRFRKGKTNNLPPKQWMILCILPLLSIFISVQIFYTSTSEGQPITFLLIFSILSLLFSNVIIFSIIEGLLRRSEDKEKLAVTEAQLTAHREHSLKLAESRTHIQQLAHDFRHHVNAFQFFIEQGQYEELSLRINELVQYHNNTQLMLDTGNPMLDVMLTTKRNVAEQENIQCDWLIQILPELPIPVLELCSIVGNALENAIEACRRAGDLIHLFIDLELRISENVLLCEVKNTIGAKPKLREGRIETLKQDMLHHGIGLKSMEESCLRLGGKLSYDYDEDMFLLHILIPL
ncbi:MAG: ATP-binding protein [Lachnospiraceae bacterium]|nr:ATP-binding protein [Lachnospiraceae bacterium]